MSASAHNDQPHAHRGTAVPLTRPRDGRVDGLVAEWRANWLSRITWSWIGKLLSTGYRRPLEMSDLGDLDYNMRTSHLADRFTSLLSHTPLSQPITSRIWRVLLWHEPTMWIAGAGKLIGDLLGFVGPLAVAGIVRFCELRAAGKKDEVWGLPGLEWELGYWWTLAIFVSGFLQNWLLQTHHHYAIRAGVRVRCAVGGVVYRKVMRLSTTARAQHGGSLQNMVQTDAINLQNVYFYIHYLWAGPLQLAITIAMLYDQLGPSSFVALAVLVAMGPLQTRIGSMTGRYAKATLQHSDTRIKTITEFLQGVRSIKFFAWERAFGSRVMDAREKELLMKRKAAVIGAVNNALMEIGPLMVALLTFLTYGYTSNEPLTAAKAFSSLSLFAILRLPLMILPMLTSILVTARVSVKRIGSLLEAEEMQDYRTVTTVTAADAGADGTQQGAAIVFDDATLAYGSSSSASGSTSTSTPSGGTTVVVNVLAAAKQAEKGASAAALTVRDPSTPSAAAADAAATPAPTAVTPFKLSNINLSIPSGKLTSIVGQLASGKSSLLAALLGELQLQQGAVRLQLAEGADVQTAIAYCPQQPWILNATLRDNILFGSPYDETRYKACLHAAALLPDLALFPGGDAVEIGERGINLSGGQKARVSLCRAMYSRCPIVLLDDVLSAVDAHVSSHIFKHGIQGALAGRTVLLVTHQLQFLQYSDCVVVMDKGCVEAVGSYTSLMSDNTNASGSAVLRGMMKEKSRVDDTLAAASTANSATATTSEASDASNASAVSGSSSTDAAAAAAATEAAVVADKVEVVVAEKEKKEEKKEEKGKEGGKPAAEADGAATPAPGAVNNKKSGSGTAGTKLIVEEDRRRGTVERDTYLAYLASYGPSLLLLILVTLIAAHGSRVVSDVWLGLWSTESGGYSLGFFIGIYAAITLGSAVLVLLQALSWAYGGIRAGRQLHSHMWNRISRSPLSLFDTTPVGRILNRFTTDVSVVDKDLVNSFSSFSGLLARILATIVVQAVVLPFVLIGVLPVAGLYLLVQQFYRHTSRELKRLDSISKSPMAAHLAETVSGLPTIRAYAAATRFTQGLEDKVDLTLLTGYTNNVVNRWLGFRLDTIGALLVGVIALVAVLMSQSGNEKEAINAGLVGLALSYALAITNLLNWLVRNATETETYLSSVERIDHYAHLPVEAALHIPSALPRGEHWPVAGAISIRNLSVRYRPELQPVLHNISLDIAPGQRIGVAGRTGSGKSSLLLALFRMLEAQEGSISIDGVDISKLGLHDLRSRLCIISQDPWLPSGTVRYALDPTHHVTDEEALWTALDRVDLRSKIEAMGGLDAQLTEGGDNLSVGERQLLSFARALLKKTRVIALDEATASVDVQADAAIQRMLRTAFADCTCIIIAHRINTILDCDKVLVLDGGRVAEYGRPSELLAKGEGGHFASLVAHSAASHQ